MIGIIGAMASEVNGLKAQMKELDIQKIGTTNFYHGILFGKEVVVAKSGIGKVNASMCTQNMIHAYKPSLIINTGCAAGVGDGIRVGDIVLASKAVQHDLDYGPLPDARGYLDGIDRVYIDADMENMTRSKKKTLKLLFTPMRWKWRAAPLPTRRVPMRCRL